MANTRYDARNVLRNEHEQYHNILKNRDVNFIDQYVTASFKLPTAEQVQELSLIGHMWKVGDRLYKLAHEHYNGRSELWWVIAWFNQKPTEAHIKPGDVLQIPLPIDKALHMFGV